MSEARASIEEVALGAFLHDAGKFMQRARGSLRAMDPQVRKLDHDILPVREQRYTHWHALWTEAFFQWMEDSKVFLPEGINRVHVRDAAVYHHNPKDWAAWMVAEADCLAAGMDRKARDEAEEADGEARGWDAFIKTALKSPYGGVRLGLGDPASSEFALALLEPGEALAPQAGVATGDYARRYEALWEGFTEEWRKLCEMNNAALWLEAVVSLWERYTWAIPSSTVDEPDISLHDHSRAAAAIAAALYQWHQEDGSLEDVNRIRDRETPKFRCLVGDLSGIQNTLFLLARQQVKGVNKLLRARSFLMGMITEGAALECRLHLGLPVFSVLQNAGGRFLLLMSAKEKVSEKIEGLRREIEEWMQARYWGELTLNLAVSEPFAGGDLKLGRFGRVLAEMTRAAEEAKQKALSTCLKAVHREADYSDGACKACGVRPAESPEQGEWCGVCEEERRVGDKLVKARAVSWSRGPGGGDVELFGGLRLGLERAMDRPPRQWLSGFRLYRGPEAAESPLALRYLANYVPVLEEAEASKAAYRWVSEEERVAPGELKTMEYLALDALEEREGETVGEALLGVLKADVDRLGLIFGRGVEDASLGRFAALSRLTDFFFAAQLTELLRHKFPSTYTVYAGGDDLVLIGPWRQMLELAVEVRKRFGEWVGGNPNITLSAAVELAKPHWPLNRTARAAEERLKQAKDGGRNRVSVIEEKPLAWEQLGEQLRLAETLSEYLREGLVSQGFAQRLLWFAALRDRAEGEKKKLDLQAAGWRAKWGYQLARNVLGREGTPEEKRKEVAGFLNGLLGLDADYRKIGQWASPRVAVSVALYRNRTTEGRR